MPAPARPRPHDGLAAEIRSHLATRTFGHALRYFSTVGSTNTHAAMWAEAGAAEGSTVIADYQQRGRGRLGRPWQAAAGQNLLFSIVLRPRIDSALLGVLTLAGSLAVADAIDNVIAPLRTAIKWPNDILLRGRKCCGMLLESVLSQGAPRAVVLGIGLNVNQTAFPQELEQRATSLLLETGRPIPRAPLVADVLARLEAYCAGLHANRAAICNAYARRMYGLGQRLHVSGPKPVTGTVLGVTAAGALRLESHGRERIVFAGDTAFATASRQHVADD